MYEYHEQHYEDVDFSHKDLRYGELTRCTFQRCKFRGTSMEEITTYSSQFIECDFHGAHLNASIHNESAFVNCRFSEANFLLLNLIIAK
ncbi:pentapeptide repeat-containing protein [Paenibacillus sp. FSL K6-2524]|uniref:pentapeptide repeat-containing protein n=1 Tax=Paenibacillus sp. FSL K6-2524 TaxID=2954516 RepID=UPI0030F7D9C8